MYLSITAGTIMYLAYVRKAPALYKKQACCWWLLPLGFHYYAFRVSEDRATEQNSNGLGLAICKSLIEAHNGSIGMYSDGIGKGAKFWFRLPLKHD